MTKSKQELIKIHINNLQQGLDNLEKSDYYTYCVAKDDLIERIIQVKNIFIKDIPEINEIILLNSGSEYRDASSLIGKMKLYLLLAKDDKEELLKYIQLNIKMLKLQLTNLEKGILEEHDALEDSLFETIMIIVNTFLGHIPEIEKTILLREGTGIRDAKTVIGQLKLEMASIYDKGSRSLGEAFLRYASETLGNTQKGIIGPDIIKYSNMYSWKYGVDIPIVSSDFGKHGSKVPNKRTALYLNLCSFNAGQQFEMISELCKLDIFNESEEVNELKIKLYENFMNHAPNKLSESELVIKTEHWLSDYPESLKQYDSAIEKYEKEIYERNILDDMRLSFELLLKGILKNQKSLENQIPELGQALKEKNISKEIRNLIRKVIEYYNKYQNDKVKHDDNVNLIEIEYIVEQTSILMKFIIKALNY